MHLIKQLLTFDIGWHHDLSTLKILHSPWLLASVNIKSAEVDKSWCQLISKVNNFILWLASVNIKSPGLTKNHDFNWYQKLITVYYGCFIQQHFDFLWCQSHGLVVLPEIGNNIFWPSKLSTRSFNILANDKFQQNSIYNWLKSLLILSLLFHKCKKMVKLGTEVYINGNALHKSDWLTYQDVLWESELKFLAF